ncbi:hypothetical protein [Clostridium sp. AM27-31LB]|jgi:hypothetical protein|uniref:hypothetical protein n=1 Tax=Clostridium sp. AM27-31LB TaxID=2293026 RepID=UPI0011C23B5C|nr:hypothetical protein [Clostridium sp. AM27-31LB]
MIDMVSSNNTFANNSMIFKTKDSSVDSTRKTLSLFNKDWNTYKTNWQQGFSQNGISGGIKSIFQSSNSVISKDQLQILRNWNNAVAHGCTNQETFNRIIKDADSNTKLYFSGLNKSKGSVEGLKNAQNVAKQSTIGLTLAQTALNTAISLGFTAALMLAVKGLDKLINSAKRASEAADEAFSDTTEKVQKNEEEAKSLDELVSKYKELKTSGNLDVDGRKEIKELQNDIADLVGVQASNLDLVNGKLDDEISKLDEISEKEAKNAYETATANYNNSKKSTDKAAGDDNYLVFDGYAYVGKKEKETIDILHNAGFKNNVQTGGLNPFNQQVFITDAWDDDYNELKGAQEKADYLQSMIDVLEQNGQRATDLYAGLISQRDKYLQYIDNQQDAANSLVNSWISYSQFSNDELSKINIDSLDSFEEYRQKMIEESKNDESIGKMLADGTLSDEDLEKAIDDFMATSTKFSKWYEKWIKDTQNTSKQKIETPKITFDSAWSSLKASDKKSLQKSALDGTFDKESLSNFSKLNSLAKEFSLEKVRQEILNTTNLDDRIGQFIDDIGNLTSAFTEMQKNGVVSTKTLQGLPEGIRRLKGYTDFRNTVVDPKSSKDAKKSSFESLISEYTSSQQSIKGVTNETRNYVINALKDVGIVNAEEIVDAQIAYGKITKVVRKVTNEVSQMTKEDADNFLKAANLKRMTNATLANKIRKNTSTLINSLGKEYQKDVNNFINSVKLKLEAQNELTKALRQSWKLEASARITTETRTSNDINGTGSNGHSTYTYDTNSKKYKKWDKQQEKVAKTRKALEDAKKQTDTNLKQLQQDYKLQQSKLSKIQYKPSTSSSNNKSSKKSKSSDTKQEIDWIARKLTVLQSIIDKTSGKLQNLFSIKGKNNNIDKQIAEHDTLIKADNKAYMKKANKIKLSKNSKEVYHFLL